jgi:hypothetical protein
MPYRYWVALLTPVLAMAQAAGPSPETRIANLEAAVKSAQSAGDNAWMLVSAALVLMMTGPGLALFYGGLVRRKNVLGTMMHSFILMAVITVLWAIVGYSLAFGEGSAVLGDLRYAFLNNVGSAPNADYAATIPHQTYMVYQLMFAIITPALMGQRWTVECVSGRENSVLRFCRRHGGAHQLRRVRSGLCALPWQTEGLWVRADEATQHRAQRNRRVSAVGGLVWI